MKKYTVGFIFDESMKHVLLVHKTAPAWQVGFINGVGGKMEEGESGIDCIVREIKEETNLDAGKENVHFVGELTEPAAYVEVFGFIYKGTLFDAYVFEKEKIEWFAVKDLPKNMITNLTWLIPLTLEKLNEQKIEKFTINYSSF